MSLSISSKIVGIIKAQSIITHRYTDIPIQLQNVENKILEITTTRQRHYTLELDSFPLGINVKKMYNILKFLLVPIFPNVQFIVWAETIPVLNDGILYNESIRFIIEWEMDYDFDTDVD